MPFIFYFILKKNLKIVFNKTNIKLCLFDFKNVKFQKSLEKSYECSSKLNKLMIDHDIDRILDKMADGKTAVFPKDGFGTGLAKLKEKAPKTYQYLTEQLQEVFGFNNNTGELQSNKQGNFIPIETPTLTKNFAGIGNNINEQGKQAIDELLDKNNNIDNLWNMNKDKILYKDSTMTKEIWDSLTNDERSEIIRCL